MTARVINGLHRLTLFHPLRVPMPMHSFAHRNYFTAELDEHIELAHTVQDQLFEPFSRTLAAWAGAIRGGHKLLFFGNGGSASDAQHLATELTVRFKRNRSAIAALALTTDTSALTAIGNDLGFDELFARQIEALGKPGDVAIAISTSGRSPNVIEALKRARDMGVTATALGGRDGGDMVGLAEPLIIVPSDTTARIQEMHIMLGQMLCGALEIELGLVPQER